MRDPLYWVPIKYKLPLTFAVICLTAFGVGGYVVATVAKKAMEKLIYKQLDDHSIASTISVDNHLELMERRVEDFASDGFIRAKLNILSADGPGTDTEEKKKAHDQLKRHLTTNKLPLVDYFVDALLLDCDGNRLLYVYSKLTPREASYQHKELWFGPIEAETKDHPYPTFFISTPVTHLNGESQIGFMQILVRADTFVSNLREQNKLFSESSFRSWLVDTENRSLPLHTMHTQADKQFSATDSGIASSTIDYSSTLSRNGWQLNLQMDKKHALQPINNLLKMFIMTGAVLLILVLLLLLFPAKFLLQPLSELRDSAQRIADGDLSARMVYDSHDEIGDLSRAFNAMAVAVEERTTKLIKVAAELEHREADIRLERDKLNTTIRSMEDGLFILDRDGSISLSNEAAMPVVAAIQNDTDQLVSLSTCENRHGEAEYCRKCLQNFNAHSHLCQIHLDSRIYEIKGTILPTPDNATAEKLFIVRDITERLVEADHQAHQERMAVLGQIAAVMAHELNNPLAAISTFGQMLESGLEPGSKHREFAEIIRRNMETCKETIRMLLDTTARANTEFSEFDVEELLRNIQRLLRPMYQRSGVDLIIDCKTENPSVMGDKLQLRQVMVNLLLNAIQAGENLGIRICIELSDQEGDIAIRISDTGPGIPADIRQYIFKPFYTTKPPGVGTGLGLSTSKRIIEYLGGSLELVDSKPGHTEFLILLPRGGRIQSHPAKKDNVTMVSKPAVPALHGDE